MVLHLEVQSLRGIEGIADLVKKKVWRSAELRESIGFSCLVIDLSWCLRSEV